MTDIAVPYFSGSNGKSDAELAIAQAGMKPRPLYFNFGNTRRLEENAKALQQMDGVVLPGGFPYEDRLGFGVVPSRIMEFSQGMREFVDSGRPVIAFCSGNQIASAIGLAFDEGNYGARLLPNICDTDGQLVYSGFRDAKTHVKLTVNPNRTAFTQQFDEGEVLETIIDHGGGRFWADGTTLQYLLANDMVVQQYCDAKGNIVDNFPINPNGSMLNIESITNKRGNLKIGMAHHERPLQYGKHGRHGLVFESMKQYIIDGCPDLSSNIVARTDTVNLKNYLYLSRILDPARTIGIYVQPRTTDNEAGAARLFLGEKLQRRRLLQIEVAQEYMNERGMHDIVLAIGGMNLYDAFMPLKDTPTVTGSELPIETHTITGIEDGKVIRNFVPQELIVAGHPEVILQVELPDPQGYVLEHALKKNPELSEAITGLHTGTAWFFADLASKERAEKKLFGRQ